MAAEECGSTLSPLAFSGRDCGERGDRLQHTLAAAVGTLQFNLFNISHVQQFCELLLAVLTEEYVSRHDHPSSEK